MILEDSMNKLMGFYELKDSGLPSIPWKLFNESTLLDEKYLWTIRTAVDKGEDLNLPRIIGKTAEEAYKGAINLYNIYKDKGIIIYYPYFIAKKSGTLRVDMQQIIIEAVNKDLWNLVTYNNKDVTIIEEGDKISFHGNKNFLTLDELNELNYYAKKIKNIFKNYIVQGKTLLLEWSYAVNTNNKSEVLGDQYLVFYEIREI